MQASDRDGTDPAPADPSNPGKHEPARRRVYEYVRDGILDGRLTDGSFLEEEHISLAVGVSRTPVREAFQQLHSERLIELLPRRGAMVRVVTVRELMEVYETRLVIETHAACKLCAGRLPPPPAMTDALAGMRQSQGTAPSLAHVRLNTVFHHALVAAAGNGVMTELYESLRLRQERVAMTSVGMDPGRRRVIFDEHVALVAALEAHDADAAAGILSQHLRPIREIVSRLPGYAEPSG
jgi:DNA-binding GntR family transcriptional regulator